MKKVLMLICVLWTPLATLAAGGPSVPLEKAHVDLSNQAAIQRGAKYFANYCMGCHAASYVRYQLMGQAGLTEDQIKDNLIFDGSKLGDLMVNAMPAQDAAEWFGGPAPDLTLTARIRGEDWIYSYLKSFYTDDSRSIGVNNTVFKNVGMPNVLWELEGIKEATYQYQVMHDGHTEKTFDDESAAKDYIQQQQAAGYQLKKVVDHLTITQPGKLTPEEFDLVARDITTYLAFIAEPMKLERHRLGMWVILFLTVFTFLAYLTKKAWWQDIHD